MIVPTIPAERTEQVEEAPRTFTGGNLADLLDRDLDPIRWTVDRLLPEGLSLLAGKPKLGKSWLALMLALMVAAGHKFLDYHVDAGTVLYIALEDGERRMQNRTQWLGARNLPHMDRFHPVYEWPTLDRGGVERLEQWMREYPQTRLIVIDTYGRIRGDVAGKDRYAEEYALLGGLQRFAIQYGVALLLIHHLRKQGADDWLEQLSGSQAVTGAADTLLGLYRERGQMDATLRLVSRDADEFDLALKFNDGRWESMGDASHYRLSTERTAILEALESLGGEGSVAEIAELVEKTPANVGKMLIGLYRDGLVKRPKRGTYSLSNTVDSVVSVANDQPETTQTTNTYDQEDFDWIEVGGE